MQERASCVVALANAGTMPCDSHREDTHDHAHTQPVSA